MNKYEDLIQAVQNLHTDFEKFYEKGQAAAGTRLRKGLANSENWHRMYVKMFRKLKPRENLRNKDNKIW